MKQLVLITLLTLFIVNTNYAHTSSLTAEDVVVSGVRMPGKLGYEGKVLHLNGAGVRTKFFMNIYVAGLYLAEKSSDAEEIINANKAMTVRLHIISAMLTSSTMITAIREGFERSLEGKTDIISKEIEFTCSVFDEEPTKVGDQYDIHFVPGVGISTSKNGKAYTYAAYKDDFNFNKTKSGRVSIPPGANNIFKKATFGIWLCDNPVDEALKDALLGIEDED